MLDKKRNGLLAVSTALLLFLGLIYAYSVLLAPLKIEFGWSVAQMTLVFALSICSFTLGSLAVGPLVRAKKNTVALVAGAAMLAAGFLGTALASGASALYAAYASYGIAASFGIGWVYNVVIPTVTSWFPDRCGFAQGVCLMGFGAGGFVLGPLAAQLYSLLPWRATLMGFVVIFATLVAGSALALKAPTDDEASRLAARAAGAGEAASDVSDDRFVSSSKMLRTPTFWLLYAFLFMLGSIGMGITGIGRELPLSLGASDLAAAVVIGFVNVGSGVGRLSCGIALDRLGRHKTMRIIGCGGTVAPLVMIASLLSGSLAVQAVACLLTGMSWGAAVVTMPFVSRTEWGQANMAQNMAVVNTYSIFASLVGSFGAGMLYGACASLLPVLGIMTALGVASVLLASKLQ
ncbi:MAG: MFS transporter [Collinsella sp.]|nr:MFS transporter [Collinsella sp.]